MRTVKNDFYFFFFRRNYIENVNKPTSGGQAQLEESEEIISMETGYPTTAEEMLDFKLGEHCFLVVTVHQLDRHWIHSVMTLTNWLFKLTSVICAANLLYLNLEWLN